MILLPYFVSYSIRFANTYIILRNFEVVKLKFSFGLIKWFKKFFQIAILQFHFIIWQAGKCLNFLPDRLRGLKPQQIADEVNYWLTEVLESPNMLTANVAPIVQSGGNRTRLSVGGTQKLRWRKGAEGGH